MTKVTSIKRVVKFQRKWYSHEKSIYIGTKLTKLIFSKILSTKRKFIVKQFKSCFSFSIACKIKKAHILSPWDNFQITAPLPLPPFVSNTWKNELFSAYFAKQNHIFWIFGDNFDMASPPLNLCLLETKYKHFSC